MRDKSEGHVCARREKGRHLWPRIVQKVAEGETLLRVNKLERESDD